VGPISRWAVTRPKSAILAWFLMAAGIIGLATSFGGSYNNSFSLPNTESATAQALLERIPGAAASFSANTARVVWGADSGTVTDPAVAAPVTGMLERISAIAGVSCVVTPYGAPIGRACPPVQGTAGGSGGAPAAAPPPGVAKVLAGLGPAGVSIDSRVGYATVIFAGTLDDFEIADAVAVLDAVKSVRGTTGLTVGASGQVLEFAGSEPPSSEGIGILVALIILLFMFGSIVGAFLPILTTILSLGAGQALILLAAKVFDVATFAPTLAVMIGLGVGIDYSLFVINRYRQALDAGRQPRDAILESVRTSGRAVVFAAATVIIALLGLFVLGITFFNGLAVAAAVTVALTMIGATVLLPAVLSLLGRRAFALRPPWARRPRTHNPDGGPFARYGRWLESHYRIVGVLALGLILTIAVPATSLRLGFTDDSGKAAGTPARTAYDLFSEGFGPGINGPFIVAVETTTAGDNAAVGRLAGAIQQDAGVAAVIAFPMAPTATVTAMQVVPATGPQDERTTELLNRMRHDIIPPAIAAGDVSAFVGGTQAITSDFTSVLGGSLPLFLLVVIGLGFLTLTLLFRSILVPLTGAITSLLSLSAAMGVTVAAFQWGWMADVLGLSGTGPILPFLPIMVFAILFGLSMDYQVFLVSRMQEEWIHTGDNRKAVRRGLAASGRVVMVAAAIMFSVFAAFILGSDSLIKLFGLALASAVLFDALIVRLIIVPSLMYQFGKANWWLPGWLDRMLPRMSVETEEDLAFESAEIDDIADDVPAQNHG